MKIVLYAVVGILVYGNLRWETALKLPLQVTGTLLANGGILMQPFMPNCISNLLVKSGTSCFNACTYVQPHHKHYVLGITLAALIAYILYKPKYNATYSVETYGTNHTYNKRQCT